MRRVLGLEERGSLALPALVGGLLVLGLIGGAVLLTRSGPDEPEGLPLPVATSTREDHSLTDAEAIARLAELDRLRIEALEKRDESILAEALAPQAPAAQRLRSTIRTLVKDDVRLVHRRYEVHESAVTLRTLSSMKLRQSVTVDVQFVDPSGNRLTRGPGVERQVLEATLRYVDGKWLFWDGRVLRAKQLKK